MNFPPHSSPLGRRARRLWLAGAMLVLLLVGACGKKGPLYLPDDTGTPGKTGGQVTMPAPAQSPK